MKEFGKLTIKKGTVLLLDDKKDIKGGYNHLFTVEEHGNVCAPMSGNDYTCPTRPEVCMD